MVPVSVYQMIPGLAWLLVAILLVGLGDDAAIFIIFAVSSMVIAIGVSSAWRVSVDAEMIVGTGVSVGY